MALCSDVYKRQALATALLLAALTVIAAHELLTAVCGPDKARRWTVLPALCGVLLLGRQVFSWPGLEWLLLAAALALPLSGVLTYGCLLYTSAPTAA